MEGNKIKLKSCRLNKELEVEVYQKDDVLIIRHTSLEEIYWKMDDAERPRMTIDTLDLRKLPGIPAMFAVKCRLNDPVGGYCIEQIGEMLCSNWQYASQITRDFPLTICKNQAFDRAFVRYLQLDISGFKAISLYSDSEIAITPDLTPCANVQEQEGIDAQQAEVTANPVVDTQEVKTQQAANKVSPMPDTQDTDNLPDNAYGIWAGMNAGYEDTGFVQTPAYRLDNAQASAASDGVASPFPWNSQNPMPQHQVMPDNIQMPEYQTGEPAANLQIPGSAPRVLAVYEVGFDIGTGKTTVVTNAGQVFYDPFTGAWTSADVYLYDVDLNDLYGKASSLIGKDLKDYNGPSLP